MKALVFFMTNLPVPKMLREFLISMLWLSINRDSSASSMLISSSKSIEGSTSKDTLQALEPVTVKFLRTLIEFVKVIGFPAHWICVSPENSYPENLTSIGLLVEVTLIKPPAVEVRKLSEFISSRIFRVPITKNGEKLLLREYEPV